jgi:hypothetical protein
MSHGTKKSSKASALQCPLLTNAKSVVTSHSFHVDTSDLAVRTLQPFVTVFISALSSPPPISSPSALLASTLLGLGCALTV